MKRSEVNAALKWAKGLLEGHNFHLPKYAYWSLDQWRENVAQLDTVRKCMLGWDITDYGLDDYKSVGGVLYTVRNGDLNDATIGVPYAEKLILLTDGQRLPVHFHFKKTEDIINRGGGVLWLKLNNSLANGDIDTKNNVEVFIDGIKNTFAPGELVKVYPGESISLTPGMYHTFGALEGAGDLIVGEVSSINDDNIDNNFNPKLPRFAKIEEDEPVLFPLCNEYDTLLS